MNTFAIEGMKCPRCVSKINSTLKGSGFPDAIVTLSPPQVEIPNASLVTAPELQKIISRAGEYKVTAAKEAGADAQLQSSDNQQLVPLFVIVAFITGGVAVRACIANDFTFDSLMNNLMGCFFVTFSLFKFINLQGFADAYATYDIVAARSRKYALAYPFIELLLGIGYVTAFAPTVINVTTLTLMLIGSIGVLRSLRSGRKIQCACLGSALKLPMTKITLVENMTMAVMAVVMLFHTM